MFGYDTDRTDTIQMEYVDDNNTINKVSKNQFRYLLYGMKIMK
jgi:hypothetical protein